MSDSQVTPETTLSMTTSTMTAMRVHEFGPPDVIRAEQLDRPEPNADEILVRVHAAGVGPWDGWIRSGRSVLDQPLPLTLGSDVAGVVERIGSVGTGLKPGDEVYGATNPRFTGGYADFALCKSMMIARKPRNLSFIEAASAPVIGVTAWQMLFDKAQVQKGQSVVIHGAAGNVGRYAVMLARAAGLRIIGTARSADLETVRTLGADMAMEASDLASLENSVDAAIDLVGGEFQPQLLRCVRRGGAFVSAVAAPSESEAAARGVRASFMLVHVERRYLDELTARFEDGRLHPNVGTVLPLGEARIAHEILSGSRQAKPGKIVLEVRQAPRRAALRLSKPEKVQPARGHLKVKAEGE